MHCALFFCICGVVVWGGVNAFYERVVICIVMGFVFVFGLLGLKRDECRVLTCFEFDWRVVYALISFVDLGHAQWISCHVVNALNPVSYLLC